MNACTPTSVFQLFAAALTFLLAVLWLEMHWVLHSGNIARALRKRGWLNALVAFGAVGATILLLFWVGACANGAV